MKKDDKRKITEENQGIETAWKRGGGQPLVTWIHGTQSSIRETNIEEDMWAEKQELKRKIRMHKMLNQNSKLYLELRKNV